MESNMHRCCKEHSGFQIDVAWSGMESDHLCMCACVLWTTRFACVHDVRCVCMWACVHVCIWCEHVCMCAFVHLWTTRFACVHDVRCVCVCVHVCMYACVQFRWACVHVCICAFVNNKGCMCTWCAMCMCAFVHVCMCEFVHLCMRACVCMRSCDVMRCDVMCCDV